MMKKNTLKETIENIAKEQSPNSETNQHVNQIFREILNNHLTIQRDGDKIAD